MFYQTSQRYFIIASIFVVLVLLILLGNCLFPLAKEPVLQDELLDISAGVIPSHSIAREITEKFFQRLASEKQLKTIILLSPENFSEEEVNNFISLPLEEKEFLGALVDQDLLGKLAEKESFAFWATESIAKSNLMNLVPLINQYLPKVKIAPFIIPAGVSLGQVKDFVDVLESSAGSQTIVVASTNFSDGLPSSAAALHDQKSIRTLINFEEDNFSNIEVGSWQALYIVRSFAHQRQKEVPGIITYKNSADYQEQEDVSETTSYFSLVFKEGSFEKRDDLGTSLLFTGDIMLDRGVAVWLKKEGVFYPFREISQLLRGVDILGGNLEGPIVEERIQFSRHSLTFNFDSAVVEALSQAKFNLMNLANNHTLNRGRSGLEQTQSFLEAAGISWVGDPARCERLANFFEEEKVAFLAFDQTLSLSCSDEEIEGMIKEVKELSQLKYLVVLFHWGQEYCLKNSSRQQELAHRVIEAGADLVIGSHPHVVQNIEKYQGRLIFYSLGNFIFDQYFSEETQQELVLGVELSPKEVIFHLFPVWSELSQPRLMDSLAKKDFLDDLAQRSSAGLGDFIKTGIITVKR